MNETHAPTLRIYDEARTAHLERLNGESNVVFAYRRRSYDFDHDLARSLGVHQLGRLGAARMAWRTNAEIIEVNEPLMLGAWPLLLLISSAVRLRSRRRPVELVAYAIENGAVIEWLGSRLRFPLGIARLLGGALARFIVGGYSRIAFGTAAAARNYAGTLGQSLAGVETKTFTALESPCECADGERWSNRVVFLGSLEPRKGIDRLLGAWPYVRHASPDAQLTVIGKGGLRGLVLESVDPPAVTFVEDPARTRIHAELREASVLVLLSQPARRWKEQIGLPILEGLSHGCTIVTTEETGLADWLSAHGHRVLPAGSADSRVAAAIVAALDSPILADEVLGLLPQPGGREQAEHWMRGASTVNTRSE